MLTRTSPPTHAPIPQDLPVWLAGVSSLEGAERRAGKELWEWWLDALSFRPDSAGRLHIRQTLKHPDVQRKIQRAVRGPRRRIARALGRGRRGAIQRGDPGYRARAPGPTGTAVRHHHTPRHGGGARLFGDELSRFCSRPSTRSTCARFRASRSWCWSGGSSRRW